MLETIVINNQPYRLTIRQLETARRLTLRGEWFTPSLRVTAPAKTPLNQIIEFLNRAEAWIHQQRLQAPVGIPFASGTSLPILGQNYTLELQRNRGASPAFFQENKLICSAAVPNQALARFLREHLKKYILPRAQYYADKLDTSFQKIFVKEFKSRWGSCSDKGNLFFHWRLVFAPLEVLDYIIVHEVCHLREFHHGPGFWALVKSFDPGYLEHRMWLKKNGPFLHAFGKQQASVIPSLSLF